MDAKKKLRVKIGKKVDAEMFSTMSIVTNFKKNTQ